VEPAELSDVVDNREMSRGILGLLPSAALSNGNAGVKKRMNDSSAFK